MKDFGDKGLELLQIWCTSSALDWRNANRNVAENAVAGREDVMSILVADFARFRAITSELAERLRQHKQDIIMRDSMRRLEAAGICIAVFETGEMRVVITETTIQAINDTAAIYSPADMRHYVRLEPGCSRKRKAKTRPLSFARSGCTI
jgi:hypothetical protein